MKAKVIETGEEIDVCRLYPVVYSRLDGNSKIMEEYNEDELEFPNKEILTVEQKKEEFRELEHEYYQKHMDIDEMGGCSMLLWTHEFDEIINAFYELGVKHGKIK